MREWALHYLCCPDCGSKLDCEVFERDGDGHILTGVLTSRGDGCTTWYPIIRGVPRIIPETLRLEATREFYDQHASSLMSKGLTLDADTNRVDKLHGLKMHTIRNFGFEWLEYSRHGWDDPLFNLQAEERVFGYKSLLKREELDGRLVLDAGCGNGRYVYWAAQYGGQVIGVDLGDGVEAAFTNTRHLPNVAILQADIFNLPFLPSMFNVIFSIGVLMHTGNARQAFESLTYKLEPGGSITVHVYGKGNPVYEFVDGALRRWTTRMSIEQLNTFTGRAFRLSRIVNKLRVQHLVGLVMRLDDHPHCIFDWYAAPIATHHTYDEIRGWFDALNLDVVATNETGPPKVATGILGTVRDIHRRVRPGYVTVRGIRRSG